MNTKGPISLCFYEEKYKEDLLAFELPPEQAEFTGLPGETLSEALANPGKTAVVIAEGGRALGFFILHRGEGIADFYRDTTRAILLRAFLINYASQGQGVAKAALAQLPGFLRTHFPSVREIVLAVNEKNISAGNLYSGAGFLDQGLRRSGHKGSQKVLHYALGESWAETGELVQSEEALQERLIGVFKRSPLLVEVFERAQGLEPYPYFVGAGCLVQTVWNELTGRSPGYGISDIDIIYYDADDLSYATEDEMIAKVRVLFEGIAIPVDLKNQARVHLWYPEKFGLQIKPYESLEAAIDCWPTTVTSLGARLAADGEWQIYAPFGLRDLFHMTLRPNKALIGEEVYMAKTQKWKNKWPELAVLPWGS
ncbi:nucleotidyltransferase family protein [Paenibacillus sp. 22594]|uniref:nucleotidyltransferase family protein n=1 Tax=Paenibacillus sp. 22594 TaxID=3453947 RepID=UPI003F82CAC7